MLRLITQNHIMMGPHILPLVSKGTSSGVLRSYFLPPSTLHRRFHLLTGTFTKIGETKMMAAEKGQKQKGKKPTKPVKKSEEGEEADVKPLERGGSCPPRLAPRCCVTLRPEDATAAACAAKAAEAVARREALAAKNAAKPCKKKLRKPPEPVVREQICATKYKKKSKFRDEICPPSKEERLMPQSTKPWLHSYYEDISERMERSPIAYAYRPVTKPIHVCTPREVRKIFAPPEKPCVPCKPRKSLRSRITSIFLFMIKAAIAAFCVLITIDLGIWESSDCATELLSSWLYGDPDKLPHLETIAYTVKETWNKGVRRIFRCIGSVIPAFAEKIHLGGSHCEADIIEN